MFNSVKDTTDYSTQLSWPYKIPVLLLMAGTIYALWIYLYTIINPDPALLGYQCYAQYLISINFLFSGILLTLILLIILGCFLLLLPGVYQVMVKDALVRVWRDFDFYFIGAILLVPISNVVTYIIPNYPPSNICALEGDSNLLLYAVIGFIYMTVVGVSGKIVKNSLLKRH